MQQHYHMLSTSNGLALTLTSWDCMCKHGPHADNYRELYPGWNTDPFLLYLPCSLICLVSSLLGLSIVSYSAGMYRLSGFYGGVHTQIKQNQFLKGWLSLSLGRTSWMASLFAFYWLIHLLVLWFNYSQCQYKILNLYILWDNFYVEVFKRRFPSS